MTGPTWTGTSDMHTYTYVPKILLLAAQPLLNVLRGLITQYRNLDSRM